MADTKKKKESTRVATNNTRVDVVTLKTVNKLAEKYDHHVYEIIRDSVKFFDNAGYDPCMMENVSTPAEELNGLRSEVKESNKLVKKVLEKPIRYMKFYERTVLNPQYEKNMAVTGQLIEILKRLDASNIVDMSTPEGSKSVSQNTPVVGEKKGKFVLPDSAMITEKSETKDTYLSEKIALEKAENKVKFLREQIKRVSSKALKSGDTYTIKLTKIEFENFTEQVDF